MRLTKRKDRIGDCAGNNETPGFGADLIADQSIFDALVGQDYRDGADRREERCDADEQRD